MSAPAPLLPGAKGPARVSQATSVEQQRATAEVLGAILAAQQAPRDLADCETELKRACEMEELAAQAFYKVPRAGQPVTGVSIHLAREIARCFANIDYGINELARDETDPDNLADTGQSEILAYARDVQRNVRASTTFIVPHRRSGKRGASLVDVDEVYSNNANYGARRVREQILAVIPRWFVAKAERMCHETLERSAGVDMENKIVKAIAAFGELGIDLGRLEARLGARRERWEPRDVAELGVLYSSIRQGTITKEEAFPNVMSLTTQTLGTVTVPAEPIGTPAEPPTEEEEQRPETDRAPATRPMSRTQQGAMFAAYNDLGIGGKGKDDRTRRLRIASALLERELGSSSEMNDIEADLVITTLRGWASRPGADADATIEDLLAGWAATLEQRHRAAEPDTAPIEPSTDPGEADAPAGGEPHGSPEPEREDPGSGTDDDAVPAEPTDDPQEQA